MNKNRVYFGMLILTLVAIVVWAFYGMLHVGRDEEYHSVSVIVNDSNSDRWISLRQGLKQAARDYNIDLNYVSTGELKSVEEEMALVDRELENGAEGVILQMISSEWDLSGMTDIEMNAAVILLETDINTEGIYTCVGPDNRELGFALSDAVKQELQETPEGKKLGIIAGNQKQLSMQQRLQGFLDGMEDTGVDIAWIIENEETRNPEELRSLVGAEAVDAVIALGNDETELMVDYLREEGYAGSDCLLYGVGCSEKAVYYLDKGMIKMLVVPNEFNMGYQSMELMAKRLRYYLTDTENIWVDYLVIDRNNMYDEDKQKVLFPIVQ